MLSTNARFWSFINGSWVKITLRPNQSLSWGKSEPTDEGYSFEHSQWEFDGSEVIENWSKGGSDCDGPISRDGQSFCAFEALRAVPMWEPSGCDYFNGAPILRPDWQKGSTVVTDVFAQAAGY